MENASQPPKLNFLPREYRQRHARRQIQRGQFLAGTVVAIILAMLAVSQLLRHQGLQRRIDALGPEYDEICRQTERLTAMQARLANVEAECQLYAFLGCRWPHTRLLSETLGPLPSEIVVDEINVGGRRDRSRLQAATRRPGPAAEKPNASLPAPTRDLVLLHGESTQSSLRITITGRAVDRGELYQYLKTLQRNAWFADVSLEEAEAARKGRDANMSFTIDLVVQPCRPAKGCIDDEDLRERRTAAGRAGPSKEGRGDA